VARSTLRAALGSALKARDTGDRYAWMEAHPNQITLLVEKIRWTSKTTEALTNGALPALLAELNEENRDLVIRLRGSLEKSTRVGLTAILTQAIHQA